MRAAWARARSRGSRSARHERLRPQDVRQRPPAPRRRDARPCPPAGGRATADGPPGHALQRRSEEHTSELQSHHDLVCRLLLEKKNKIILLVHIVTLYELIY